MGILEKLIGRLFLSLYGFFFASMFFFRLLFDEGIDYSVMLINSIYVGLLVSALFFFYANRRIKLTENDEKDANASVRIKTSITKEVLLDKLNTANKSKYIIDNKDNYFKIYTYITFKSFGELIFITFEKDGLLVTSRHLFPTIMEYGKNEENIKLIENLIKEI